MKIDYHNMQKGTNKRIFALKYILNMLRTWYIFHFRFPWVKYKGFVRVMSHTSFAKGTNVCLGHNVQFGNYCNIATDLYIKNNVLCAGRVCFVGKNDHTFKTPGMLIWDGERGGKGTTIIEDDVWLGHNVTVVGPVCVGRGSIVAAGSVVTKNIPPCEIWAGVPAKKVGNRFQTDEATQFHLNYLDRILDNHIC